MGWQQMGQLYECSKSMLGGAELVKKDQLIDRLLPLEKHNACLILGNTLCFSTPHAY
jgi:hypothetical protein